GYATLIARIVRELPGVHLHIVPKRLQPGAGNPRVLVERAMQIIANIEEPFAIKAILLDVGNRQSMVAARVLAADHGIDHIIWQNPDHEALLLRHLPGCHDRRPPPGQSLAALRQEWDNYRKPMSAQELAERITMDQVRQACTVEPQLRGFLEAIGIV